MKAYVERASIGFIGHQFPFCDAVCVKVPCSRCSKINTRQGSLRPPIAGINLEGAFLRNSFYLKYEIYSFHRQS